MKKSMFYGATPIIFERAKRLRNNMTTQEKKLWEKLRLNRMKGLRFKAQHPMASYIADFYCHKLRLVIEIDGPNHSQSDQFEYDQARTSHLEQLGVQVIRFTNDEIDDSIDSVLMQIESLCTDVIQSKSANA
ncbi:endonuclease domain-containing protein [Roseivirga sp.]|uniref:endonuclease domain-containing protein n=1 Tax=Roseivirga sp. TaxID=1964215 RepID=UPI003B528FDD